MFMCVLLLYTLYMSGMLRHRGCRKPLCVYVCSIIIHIIYEWHAEAQGVQEATLCLCVFYYYTHYRQTDRQNRLFKAQVKL